MKRLPLVASVVAVVAGLILSATLSFGKPEYTKKEKKGCVSCHVTAKSKELNDVGKCYGEKKDLKACVK
ncbi:MAG: hypothetical protein HY820_33890 [Acidobacteria bacterium]|nr:hypothetical protein [Acidobacteriota bacterium]